MRHTLRREIKKNSNSRITKISVTHLNYKKLFCADAIRRLSQLPAFAPEQDVGAPLGSTCMPLQLSTSNQATVRSDRAGYTVS